AFEADDLSASGKASLHERRDVARHFPSDVADVNAVHLNLDRVRVVRVCGLASDVDEVARAEGEDGLASRFRAEAQAAKWGCEEVRHLVFLSERGNAAPPTWRGAGPQRRRPPGRGQRSPTEASCSLSLSCALTAFLASAMISSRAESSSIFSSSASFGTSLSLTPCRSR